jgi:Aminoglycoside-2''-adenylyltransferase
MAGHDGPEDQLAAIASLADALDSRGVEYWLFGGWAVDFWVGEVTRRHDDVDVAAWRHDYDAIKAALETAGWRHTPAPDDLLGTRYRWRSVVVEFTFVETDGDGRVLLPMAEQPVVWSTEPFGDSRRELRGVSSRVVPLALLKAGKSVPREGAADAAKDRADFDSLSRIADEG